MEDLTNVERELVALGAALGSNCVPCIQYHIPEARKVGLTDGKIGEAIRLADKVRQVPARKVLAAAVGMLSKGKSEEKHDDASAGGGSGCAESAPKQGAEQPCCA